MTGALGTVINQQFYISYAPIAVFDYSIPPSGVSTVMKSELGPPNVVTASIEQS